MRIVNTLSIINQLGYGSLIAMKWITLCQVKIQHAYRFRYLRNINTRQHV